MKLAGDRTMVKLYLNSIYIVGIDHAVSLNIAIYITHNSTLSLMLQLGVSAGLRRMWPAPGHLEQRKQQPVARSHAAGPAETVSCQRCYTEHWAFVTTCTLVCSLCKSTVAPRTIAANSGDQHRLAHVAMQDSSARLLPGLLPCLPASISYHFV